MTYTTLDLRGIEADDGVATTDRNGDLLVFAELDAPDTIDWGAHYRYYGEIVEAEDHPDDENEIVLVNVETGENEIAGHPDDVADDVSCELELVN